MQYHRLYGPGFLRQHLSAIISRLFEKIPALWISPCWVTVGSGTACLKLSARKKVDSRRRSKRCTWRVYPFVMYRNWEHQIDVQNLNGNIRNRHDIGRTCDPAVAATLTIRWSTLDGQHYGITVLEFETPSCQHLSGLYSGRFPDLEFLSRF